MLHIPLLRAGKPYRSLNVLPVTHFQTGDPLLELSQANAGLIARDLEASTKHQAALETPTTRDLIEICQRAAPLFLQGDLPVGEATQTPADYLAQVSATTGMPLVMAARNMEKITTALERMAEVLSGLTRNTDLDAIKHQFRRETDVLGAVLPNNSPGVHALWLPAIPLRVPLALKPGSREPWTPYRIAQAFMAAGCPPQAFGYYPTDINGTREILLRSGRSMFFGDAATVSSWQNASRIQVHGPGWSKVLLGADKADAWKGFLDLMETSVAANGGRSCINASGIWTAAHGRELAEGLAQRLAAIPARAMDDPQARLSAFTSPALAKMISRRIDALIDEGGAEDVTAKYRAGDRLVELDGCTFLLPTVIWCERPDHPLAHSEFLFPFCAVVELPQEEIPAAMGSTLVATLLSEDQALVAALLSHGAVDRLNTGPIPTTQIRWDQPHEGNLFELLYKQRAVQTKAF